MRLFWLALVVTACGSPAANEVPPVAYEGTLPASASARYFFNTLTVEASVDGATSRPLLVDTGSPLTGVDPTSWPDAAAGGRISPSLSALAVGPLTFEQVPSAPLTECGTSCGPYDVTGVLGGNVLRSFVVGFDYQGPTVVLGPTTLPSDAQGVGHDDRLRRGGRRNRDHRRRRRSGRRRPAHAAGPAGDHRGHGAHAHRRHRLELHAPAAVALRDHGLGRTRPAISQSVSTASGAAQGSVARTHTLVVGAAQATGSPVGSIPDDEVDDLATEIGGSVDGMLGGSFLRAFYATSTTARGQLSLYPYVTADPLADEFDRVGVFLAEDGAGGYVVAQAVEPSEQGLVGEPLVDVDGTPVAGLDPDQADRLCGARPGRPTRCTCRPRGGVEAQTLPVQDVLPLSP